MPELLKSATSVTVRVGPMVDAADGFTLEPSLTIQKANVRLSKNGGNYAAASADQGASDAGAPYDEVGEYDIALNATDTDTLGRLRVSIAVAGARPVTKDFLVVLPDVYDALVEGTGGGIRAKVATIVSTLIPEGTQIATSEGVSASQEALDLHLDAIEADTQDIQSRMATEEMIDDLTELVATADSQATIAAAIVALAAAVEAVDAKTENLPSDPADQSALAALIAALEAKVDALPTAVGNADALLGRSIAGGANGGRTVQSALRALRNKVAITAGTMVVYEEDDTTPAFTAAVTTTAGNPISSIDPA